MIIFMGLLPVIVLGWGFSFTSVASGEKQRNSFQATPACGPVNSQKDPPEWRWSQDVHLNESPRNGLKFTRILLSLAPPWPLLDDLMGTSIVSVPVLQ